MGFLYGRTKASRQALEGYYGADMRGRGYEMSLGCIVYGVKDADFRGTECWERGCQRTTIIILLGLRDLMKGLGKSTAMPSVVGQAAWRKREPELAKGQMPATRFGGLVVRPPGPVLSSLHLRHPRARIVSETITKGGVRGEGIGEDGSILNRENGFVEG